MKTWEKASALVLIYALSSCLLSARAIRIPTPDELAGDSALICNGLVESISNDEPPKKQGPITPDDLNGITVHYTVKIKVLHVFKGIAPDEIAVQYVRRECAVMLDGPLYLNLNSMPGHRYHFFLKNGPSQSAFFYSLSDAADDLFSVIPMLDSEPDANPYISKADAITLATQYLKENHPEFAVVQMQEEPPTPLNMDVTLRAKLPKQTLPEPPTLTLTSKEN